MKKESFIKVQKVVKYVEKLGGGFWIFITETQVKKNLT
jgi:hypothetical protein